MYANYGEFLETFKEKSVKAIENETVSFEKILELTAIVGLLVEPCAKFEALLGAMNETGLENYDVSNLRESLNIINQFQEIFDSIISQLEPSGA